MILPELYAIVDAETLARRGVGLREFAEGLRAAEVEMVQWRAKRLSPQAVLEGAAVLREVLGDGCLLVMNDRVDLAVIAGFDGVHVGQEDMGVEEVRAVGVSRRVTGERGLIVGVSTHDEEQVRAAEAGGADYVAIGPVFGTATKTDAEAVVGLEGVRRARQFTSKPLVAIGGITRENARGVREAGADAVAVIGGLMVDGERVEDVARGFMGAGWG